MGWIKTFSFVMRSNLTALKDRFENPEWTLRQLLLDMEEEVSRLRAAVARAFADEVQLRRAAEKAKKAVNTWDERAARAMREERNDDVRTALDMRLKAESSAESLRNEYQAMQTETAKLHASLTDLETKVRQAKHKQTLLLARMVRADSGQRINEALNASSCQSAFAEFERLEERVARKEALGEAYEKLRRDKWDTKDSDARFDLQERHHLIEEEFEALRARMAEAEDGPGAL